MYVVTEHDTSRQKDDKKVAKFFDEQQAWDYAKEHQSRFSMESPIVVGVKKELD